MISVAQAQAALFDLVSPLPVEWVPLAAGLGRVLAQDLRASRAQPPFDASAMDGYAMRAADAMAGSRVQVIGESAAGHAFGGAVSAGQAVRIFTGAVVPKGADCIVIQEDVTPFGDHITITETTPANAHIRPAGNDFDADFILQSPTRLRAADLALLAAMNHAQLPVYRQPQVAIISTGDELVLPGQMPGPDQIIASNTFGIKAQLQQLGAKAHILPIARDNEASLRLAFDLAAGADLIVTIGGASVGDHDLVGAVAAEQGLDRQFYKVAMRPGKPLMAGRMGNAIMLGLPGNPVSAMVCTEVFLHPIIEGLQGLPLQARQPSYAPLAHDIGPNGNREHYMRADITKSGRLNVFENQDSAKLRLYAQARALVIRPPNDGPQPAGAVLPFIPLG